MVQFSDVPVVGQAGYIEVNTAFQKRRFSSKSRSCPWKRTSWQLDDCAKLVTTLKVLRSTSRELLEVYSNPPNHEARTVFQILSNPELYEEWSSSFKAMATRIIEIRKAFQNALEEGVLRKWNHITDQKGMFIYLHLTDNQVEYLRNFHYIYMVKFGRVNATGLSSTNISYVAKAINDTLRKNI